MQEEEEDKKLAEILKVPLMCIKTIRYLIKYLKCFVMDWVRHQVMQSPGPESLSCEYDVLSAKSLLSKIIRAVKGNFGFSVRKLRYESLPDEVGCYDI